MNDRKMPGELHGAANWCGYDWSEHEEFKRYRDANLRAMNETEAWMFAIKAAQDLQQFCAKEDIPFRPDESDDFSFTAEKMHAYWEWLNGVDMPEHVARLRTL